MATVSVTGRLVLFATVIRASFLILHSTFGLFLARGAASKKNVAANAGRC